MKISPTYKMQFKRRREGRTDYANRLKLLYSKKLRLVVRRSLKYITAQIVQFEKIGDKTLVATTSEELKKMGWKFSCDNLPAAYLTGLLIGKKAVKAGIKDVILDSGIYSSTKGNRVYAVVKGVIDAGVEIPVGEDVLPNEERIKGFHIAKYLDRFADLPKEFEKIKQKVG